MAWKVLVVEDEEDIAEVLVDRLESWGFQPAAARTGAEGLSQVERVQPDIVLLDIRLPDQDGISVLRQIRQRHGALPVLIVSASYSPDLEQQARDLGATDFVLKPFDPPELKAKILQALGQEPD